MRPSTLAFGAAVAAAGVSAQSAVSAPAGIPQLDRAISQGCFTSKANMTTLDPQIPGDRMSSGSCNAGCKEAGYWVSGLHGPQCLCGFAMPPENALVDDSKCNVGCSSYPQEACGGKDTYTIFNLGVQIDPPVYNPSKSSTAAASSKTSNTDATATGSPSAAHTSATVTETSKPVQTSQPEKSGPNVAGIAAGVVVGVIVTGAAIGGFFFYMRRKRNAEIEEEHRRNAAVSAFISGSTPPSSHGSISMTDSRMDPVMAHRRMSDGSIADNEDYSRKILRVTNA
ncbi:WSC domain containing protein [Metarhizium album ARSEF 1941]|uniref:WSC domain containing protein n=1 Tax=Metarhizium album (strain ARSEF 1941) TaxID=1081103 RepID=A0A0B2X8G5_METAS|nr:WSC domain containing protein [Metarhizium album ARSEF 1941]KHO02073.1 WSC domain containing protein [Metarhizium album ARSEF 1941]